MSEWKQVDEQEFWATVNPLDVTPFPIGKWPYIMMFADRGGTIVAKLENQTDGRYGPTSQRYWVKEEL